MPNPKLELTWIGKGEELEVEPRILLHDADKDYGDPNAENMLIHGDNLLALKALEQEYAGRVKCIYIDPPYNTGAAFEYYDDSKEHSIWLDLMYQRLVVLKKLLMDGGTIWISIDNTEAHYLKVICDEIFLRSNFVADITYEKSNVSGLGQGGTIVNTGEKILVYKKGNPEFNEVLGSERLGLKTMKRYSKVLYDEGEKELVEVFLAPSNGLPVKVFKHTGYNVGTISLRDFSNRENEIRQDFFNNFRRTFRTYVIQEENEFQNALMDRMQKGTLYSVEYTPNRGKNKDKYTRLYYYNAELCAWLCDTAYIEGKDIVKTTKLSNVWKNDDIPKADLGNEGGVTFQRSKKPEKLIQRILLMSTNPEDIVLDSFLGSGTTAAVAQKMGRRWIGIELEDHAYTHCKVRLDRVIDGVDQSGISKSENWQGGGGYKFYELAPTLIVKDKYGRSVFSDKYNSEMLVAAVSKINGFRYAPDKDIFWKQGVCQDNSYIFVTTEYFTTALLDGIYQELGEFERLLVCAPAFDVGLNRQYENITVRKIPDSVLEKCKYGVDNYNLKIVNPPELDEEEWEDA